MNRNELWAYGICACALVITLALLVKRCGGQRAAVRDVPDNVVRGRFDELREASGQ